MDAYERAYKEGLKTELIDAVKRHVKEWRDGDRSARACMYDIETWVHEIWGEE